MFCLSADTAKVLGTGEFGIVYKGTVSDFNAIQNALDVAVKTTKSKTSASILKSVLSEIKTMIYIGQHENVVGLVGAYTAEVRKGII